MNGAPFAYAAPPPAPAPQTDAPAISLGPDGRVNGVDGMLDQVASALVKHARPLVMNDLLPAVRQDVALQQRLGESAGRSAAQELKPWIVIGVGALAVLAVVQVARWQRGRR